MKIKSLVSVVSQFATRNHAFRHARRSARKRVSNRRPLEFLNDELESRLLLATFAYDSTTGLLAIETDQNNEAFTILSSSESGNYTITSSVNFSGTDTTGLTGTGSGTLTIGTDIANLTSILITNNAANSGSMLPTVLVLSTGPIFR